MAKIQVNIDPTQTVNVDLIDAVNAASDRETRELVAYLWEIGAIKEPEKPQHTPQAAAFAEALEKLAANRHRLQAVHEDYIISLASGL